MNTDFYVNLVILPETDSTNNHANRQLADNSVEEWTVFLAQRQVSGRGQVNNSWESEPDRNLTFSLVLHPDFLEVLDQFMLSKVVTLGICAALRKYGIAATVKWPNDIYVGEKKLAGILIENSIMSGEIRNSVVGIGLNVNQAKFVSNAPNPVSMLNVTGTTYNLQDVLFAVLGEIHRFYLLLQGGEYELVNRRFLANLFRINETHQFISDGRLFAGRIVGVNEIGQLLVEDLAQKQVREFYFKEVSYVL